LGHQELKKLPHIIANSFLIVQKLS